MRARLIKFFEWRNCESADELTDEVFDRVVKKIASGEQIQNINAYAATVAQFVCKEDSRLKFLRIFPLLMEVEKWFQKI